MSQPQNVHFEEKGQKVKIHFIFIFHDYLLRLALKADITELKGW